MSTIETIATIVNRAAVALVGVLLGLLTFFPNVMMSDSGTTAAQLAAGLGVLASFLMALGGICRRGARLSGSGLVLVAARRRMPDPRICTGPHRWNMANMLPATARQRCSSMADVSSSVATSATTRRGRRCALLVGPRKQHRRIKVLFNN
jgi:hypothetical protein